ncbi:hypothetical protein SS50377_23328 [Spironucleus salmonicida]|uniref:Uncharacterized protein n=1 Tax=Spironucleus salmonicida TaxID=348837 RepID=V6LSJ3_9EUKA|nr:hypothetical protein SS50377_23328 [Spironucleus salmonicida]|eukprot:EST47198.1 Hypothetical protein SS50377_12708 [Spironucleus salmonicida]
MGCGGNIILDEVDNIKPVQHVLNSNSKLELNKVQPIILQQGAKQHIIQDQNNTLEEEFQKLAQTQQRDRPTTPNEMSFNNLNIRKSTYQSYRLTSTRETDAEQSIHGAQQLILLDAVDE